MVTNLCVNLISILFFLEKADVIERMRQQYKKDLLKIVDIVLSHKVCDFPSHTRFIFSSSLCH